MIDPASLGEQTADTSVRPAGLNVTAKAWPPGKLEGPASLAVVLTEFVDPSGIATCFHVPDSAKSVDDELLMEK